MTICAEHSVPIEDNYCLRCEIEDTYDVLRKLSQRHLNERTEMKTLRAEIANLKAALAAAEHTEGEFSRLVERLSRLAQGREMTVSEFAWEVSQARKATRAKAGEG